MFEKLSKDEAWVMAGVWLLALKQLAGEAGRCAFLAEDAKTNGQKEYHIARLLELLTEAKDYANNLLGEWNDTDRMQWDHYYKLSYNDMSRRYQRD